MRCSANGRRIASNPGAWCTSDPRFHSIPGLSMDEQRERVLGQLGLLVEEGAIQRAYPVDLGREDNHGGNLAAFEELVFADPSLQIKSGVQWGLFGAAILHLGTRKAPREVAARRHRPEDPRRLRHDRDRARLRRRLRSARPPPTTRRPRSSRSTPRSAGVEEFLGNAALHGQAAVVFAQLITKGVNHGVHAFFVPIRTPDGELLPASAPRTTA